MATARFRDYWKLHRFPILMVITGMAFYMALGYSLEREDTIRLFTLYGACAYLAYKLLQLERYNFKFLLGAGLLFRLVLLFATPELSTDFYRFLWDGQLLLQGVNPYLHTPEELYSRGATGIAYAEQLFEGMGQLSRENHSNYPPLNQVFFALGSGLGGGTLLGSVLALRVLIIGADLAIFYLGIRLLKRLNRSPHAIFWYFLNPLVIVELTGNLHFEGVMLALLLGGLVYLQAERWVQASFLTAAAIATKLIPLLGLPLAIPYLGWKRGLLFGALTTLVSLATFLPFLSPEMGNNYLDTVSLWFSNFEFNAGLYNLVQFIAVNLGAKPWELIVTYGKVVFVLMVLLVGVLSIWRRQETFVRYLGTLLLVYTAFFLLTATVHPWYIILPLLLCVFTDYRFPVFWSAVVVLSYSAYADPQFTENPALLFIEYLIVFLAIAYEMYRPIRL